MDDTEQIRRLQQAQTNADPRTREEIEKDDGPTWNKDELERDFEVLGFMAPLVIVRRKSDGRKGSLRFRHHPRIYFSFVLAS
jgi:hypothetical protein